MPVQTALWMVGETPVKLVGAALATEKLLETMIMSAPQLLSDEWMLIGQQEETGFGGRIDLLAIAPDASLVLVELKRERTPRDVVAQALDYASWLDGLTADKIRDIYTRFRAGGSLAKDFKSRYGVELAEENLNQTHQIIIVASSMDASTERIVNYLSARDLAINVLFFQVFSLGDQQILARTWLLDPAETQINATTTASGHSEPWNGEFYCSFGEDDERSWADAVRYGFVSAGGGVWYTRTLGLLSQGDRLWAKIPGRGFVGVGVVMGKVQAAKDFVVQTESGPKRLLELDHRGNYLQHLTDADMAEYLVPVKWLDTVPAERAFSEIGLFGNQNTICQPTAAKWRTTVDRLKLGFSDFDRKDGRN